ncbi:response regulator transcription factor [Aestuariimicrobium sp. p3-SID1156]|uniref:response regulator n=1 Tax=Aestuariimicrobium sp. p3-SID1156 TaxID=2916038 RepID=UPI00223B4F4B|nr:response regulator transcription factor [Aestuariimicrobium sp. p3-SID1156]MCT1458134.1 response regulator transcription factor [Aestuariimicrobium sp. p3-SID1156]
MSEGTVLVVDDEPALAKALEINLRARGYLPLTANSGRAALQAVADHHVDAIILDLGLPDMDGTEVLAGLRGWNEVPIIVLSARHTSDDKVEALDAGADDYVTKPFGMAELMARLRAALRRVPTPDVPALTVGNVIIDLARHEVSRAGEAVHLTPTEWRFLEVLARRPGTLVTQQAILTEVWGPQYATESQYLRVYAATMRRKLEDDPSHPQVVITEPGMGYRLGASVLDG